MKNKVETKTNIFRRIYLWWKFEGRYYHNDFKVGVKNLWKWFPVVWKDRDWDHTHILEVMKFKLAKQAKYIGERDFYTTAKRNAEIMMTCVRLMDKIQDGYYESEYMDYHVSEFEFVPIEGDPEYSRLEINEISENFDDYFKKRPTAYRQVMKNNELNVLDTETKKHIAMRMGRYQHQKARKLLFSIMERNIEGWWD